MSFGTPEPVPSGIPQLVLEVSGQAPTSLEDFAVEDVVFTVGEEMHYRIQGCGRVTGDRVRFHEKDARSGKDVRVWEVTERDAQFFVEPAQLF